MRLELEWRNVVGTWLDCYRDLRLLEVHVAPLEPIVPHTATAIVVGGRFRGPLNDDLVIACRRAVVFLHRQQLEFAVTLGKAEGPGLLNLFGSTHRAKNNHGSVGG